MLRKGIATNDNFTNFEARFIGSLSVVTVIIALSGVVINIFLGFDANLIILPLIAAIIFTGTYFWAKCQKYFFLLKVFVNVLSIVFVNFFWYYNYGSHGPAPYFFVIISSLIIFIWQKKQLFIVYGILIINILILFYLDYANPEITANYKSNGTRITDVYTGCIMYGAFIFVLVNNARKSLMSEYEKAKRSDNLKTAFLANMSHEIRTPMNSIIGFSDLLSDDNITVEEKNSYIAHINKAGDTLLNLINDILDIAKIEAGQITITKSDCDLNAIFNELCLVFNQRKEKLNKNDVTIIFTNDQPSQKTMIHTDPQRLKQIVTNLVGNSLKFTEKGHIEFGYDLAGNDKYIFSVKDTGIGISPENQQLIFKRFSQVDGSHTRNYGGTGLGLTISKNLVELMGGKLWVDSTPGQGSTFYFTLPIS